jgi:hypothetical protein
MRKFVGFVRQAFLGRFSRSPLRCPGGRQRNRARLAVEQFEPRDLPSGMPMADMTAVMNLVPDAAVTDTAVQSGNWSSPGTWAGGHLPGNNANVLIPMGLSVTVDAVETARLHTVRVDGLLQFATNQNTGLLVDTIVVMAGGTFDIGTATNPIAAGDTATVTFTDSARIDTTWDPQLFSRGLISMGTVSLYGQTITSFEPLAGSGVSAGATQLKLAQAPTSWKVGDTLVLPGTNSSLN